MEYIAIFGTIAIISLLAAMSPGPDFIVVTKNSLSGSRAVGLYTVFGVGLGIMSHVTYSLIGIGFIISQSIILFTIIKYVGALYLFYLAYQLLKAKRNDTTVEQETVARLNITNWQALKEGFFTNSLNPKATLFFLSIFTQVIDPSTPLFIQGLLGVEVAVIVAIWFATLSLIITHKSIAKAFNRSHYYLMKLMGGALVLLGIKLALENK
ncbi:LysE family transporter [Candidatus Kaiserbacteria bacterium]|nr:LysE family transporter [Candidatus Kaiserbacteria bacterium]